LQPIRKTPTKEKQRPGIDIGDLLIETPFLGKFASSTLTVLLAGLHFGGITLIA
jgi:hypothetical protein